MFTNFNNCEYSKMAARGPQKGWKGLQRGPTLIYWTLWSTFATKVFGSIITSKIQKCHQGSLKWPTFLIRGAVLKGCKFFWYFPRILRWEAIGIWMIFTYLQKDLRFVWDWVRFEMFPRFALDMPKLFPCDMKQCRRIGNGKHCRIQWQGTMGWFIMIELHIQARIQAVSWERCTFSNEILTFWNCASKNSKEFHVFFKFGINFGAQILKIYKVHWKSRTK